VIHNSIIYITQNYRLIYLFIHEDSLISNIGR